MPEIARDALQIPCSTHRRRAERRGLWEYRHLPAWAGVRIVSGIVLAGLGVVTFSFGGNDWKTYGWTMAFLAAAANLAFASWELSIARSAASRP